LLGALTVARETQTPNPSFTSLLVRWDASYYVPLTQHGYPKDAGDVRHAFFPLYPIVCRLADAVVPGRTFSACVAVSLVMGAVAAVLVWYVAARLVGEEHAHTAVLMFCLFPGTVVFGWPYADSMLLACVAGAVLLLTYEQWFYASLVAGIATATKPGGLALAAACVCAAWQYSNGLHRNVVNAVIAGALSTSGFVAYTLWLWDRTHRHDEWFYVERHSFGEGKHLDRVLITFRDIVTDAASFNRTIIVLFVAIALTLLVAGVVSSLPLWAKVLTVVAMWFTLTANIASASPRFALVALPGLIALAPRLRGDARTYWLVASGMLSFALVVLYTTTIMAAP
jgi:hypothetical protein